MAADVSGNSEALVTKDLLGSLSNVASSKLEEEFQFPEDLKKQKQSSSKKGKVSPKRHKSSSSSATTSASSLSSSSSTSSSSASNNKRKAEGLPVILEALQDWNHQPKSNSTLEETFNLDLKLEFFTESNRYQSVCTLEKVKSALERAERERQASLSNTKAQNRKEEEEQKTSAAPEMFAAGCPGCLFYVIATKTNPQCPRCNAVVTSPLPVNVNVKKRRIDLNTDCLSFS